MQDWQQRRKEAEMIRKYHPDKIPVLLSPVKNSKLKEVDQNKILILKSFSIFKIIMVIKKKLELTRNDAIYIFAGNTLLQAQHTLGDVYDRYAEQDLFLHLYYCEYATFGKEDQGQAINKQ